MFQSFYNQIKGSHFARGAEAGFASSFGYHRKAIWKNGMRTYEKGGFLGRSMATSTADEVAAQKFSRLSGVFNIAYLGYSAYSGYQEGGVWGATKNLATDLAIQSVGTGLWNAAMGAVGSGVAIGMGAAAAGAYGYYKLGEAGQQYARKLSRLEMGTDIVDTFGTIATMRQRSLNAIQNSRVNGRMALGNEAAYMHMPYRMI